MRQLKRDDEQSGASFHVGHYCEHEPHNVSTVHSVHIAGNKVTGFIHGEIDILNLLLKVDHVRPPRYRFLPRQFGVRVSVGARVNRLGARVML